MLLHDYVYTRFLNNGILAVLLNCAVVLALRNARRRDVVYEGFEADVGRYLWMAELPERTKVLNISLQSGPLAGRGVKSSVGFGPALFGA